MHYGFKIIDELCDGLSNWLDEKGIAGVEDVIGASAERYSAFNEMDLSYRVVATIDEEKCIRCNLCYAACDEGAHQAIDLTIDGAKIEPSEWTSANRPLPYVREDDCVGCNLCSLVCPIDDCIIMEERPPIHGSITWGEISNDRPAVTLKWDEMEKFRQEKGIDIH